MPRESVFDSTESVIGVLWDLAFSFFVARIAFFYSILAVAAVLASFAALTVGHAAGHAVLPSVFSSAQSRRLSAVNTLFREIRGKGATSAIGYVGEPALIHPTATAHVSTVSSGPVMTTVLVVSTVLSVAASCRLLMDYAKIPRHRGFRVAIGAVSALYISAAWLVAYLITTDANTNDARVPLLQRKTVLTVGATLVASVAAMPWLSMEVLERLDRRTQLLRQFGRKHRRAVDSIDRTSRASVSTSATESEDELAGANEKHKTRTYKKKTGNGRLLKEKPTKKRYDLRRNPKQTEKVDLI
ncbi:hypothetical protein F503_01079 [Ophiostoma piceae UAMH 11346]|uniref:Uncharacterized protein n=1 Tax=Ophiostoma piceae (strain UAMH 11346) TaxID=1262450 RepID=S3C8N2_OPHP1|nr:hypothetical protein F503_01079 [Ophiostoma piceae UAMH 11346]